MTSQNRLDDSLRWRTVGKFEAGQSQATMVTSSTETSSRNDRLQRSRKHQSWTPQEWDMFFSEKSRDSLEK
ncbi:hypothetical protein TNCV_151541 [Trichonephila clavipes]|uniref:Uncharacterized protein n=1 Tax=Trichonephila clavipes TaxID=2585209 RepID=A0A8X6V3L9_TRICX|nr:hypothetical protein TNCV_151541 [Trichonephila clavipes]